MYQFSEIYKAEVREKDFDFFTLVNPKIIKRPNFQGVYVWGFKFNEGKGPFMPYYVGQAGGGSDKSKSTIYQRLKAHYNFKPGNYHVIKKSKLKQFNQIILTDEQINEIAQKINPLNLLSTGNQPVVKDLFENYESNFDYLNKVYPPNNHNKFISKDTLLYEREYGLNSQSINDSIKSYQQNFYVCWIEYNKLENETDAIRKTNIKRLEKYIHVLVKGYKGQRLIGEDLTVRNKEFGLIGTSNLYPNDVFI